jgi:hypothetical protein
VACHEPLLRAGSYSPPQLSEFDVALFCVDPLLILFSDGQVLVLVSCTFQVLLLSCAFPGLLLCCCAFSVAALVYLNAVAGKINEITIKSMKKQVDLFIVPFINLHIYIGMSVCLEKLRSGALHHLSPALLTCHVNLRIG